MLVIDICKLLFLKKLKIDSCIGGFILPFAEKLGYNIPKFDFRVDGVTSISADIHKYGYSIKGASVLVFKNADYRKFQYFCMSEWPGIYLYNNI
jgi:sphinganine-1-phosphate aldolase